MTLIFGQVSKCDVRISKFEILINFLNFFVSTLIFGQVSKSEDRISKFVKLKKIKKFLIF